MEGYIYLVRNLDLFKIGHTEDLERRMRELKPTEILAFAKSTETRNIEASLHKRYAHSRIPQTEYFRLSDSEVSQACALILGLNSPGDELQAFGDIKRKMHKFSRPASISTYSQAKKIQDRVSFKHEGRSICVFRYPYHAYKDDHVYDSMEATPWNIGSLMEHGCEILPKGKGSQLVSRVVYHFLRIDQLYG